MKLVGDAVRDGQYFINDGSNKLIRGIKLLGLTSWGYVKFSEKLVNPDINTYHETTYNANIEIRRRDNVPLNGDHTHFVLIDDGSRGRFFGKYTDFITKFELLLRDHPPKV